MLEKRLVTSSKAIEYLKEQLFTGSKLLSSYLHSLALEDGEIYSLVPYGTDEKTLYDFQEGKLYTTDRNASDFDPRLIPVQNKATKVLIDMISDHLKHENKCCVFEEPVAMPDDAWVATSDIEYVFVQKDMFYFFDETKNDKIRIEKALLKSVDYYFVCVLGSLERSKRVSIISKTEIQPAILEEIARMPETVIVKAYDGEGYLIWERKKQS